jgi:Transposase zinc-binding domain
MMDRPRVEVGEVFRRYGEAYRHKHVGSLSRDQLRVMSATERCRTAALGGHVEQCDQCHFQRIAYNSCLMGSTF